MMEWTAASDAVTAAGDLEYRLYYSASDSISTAADARTNGTAVVADGPYIYLAGYEHNGSNSDWRIEKRDLAAGSTRRT